MTTLGNLFKKYNFPELLFKNNNKKFLCSLDSIEIKFLKNFGHGIFPKDLEQINIDKIFQDGDSSINELEYPEILNLNIDLLSFYDNATYSPERKWCGDELSIVQNYYMNIIITNDYDKLEIDLISRIIFSNTQIINYITNNNLDTTLSKDIIPKFVIMLEEFNNDSVLEKTLKIQEKNAKIVFKYNKENYKNFAEVLKGCSEVLFESSLNF